MYGVNIERWLLKYDQEVQRWQIMPVVLALGRLKQNCCKFKVSMELIVPASFVYVARHYLQTKRDEKRWEGDGEREGYGKN